MDITPIYELRNRLRTAMIAGTNLMSEDFRLKKAVEEFAPLSLASPVFGKINDLAVSLLDGSSPAPETLLDTITLVDAVITTLGTTEVTGEPEDIPIEDSGAVIVNIPYSKLSIVMNTFSGVKGGNLNKVFEIRKTDPKIFSDYRVTPLLVSALGMSSSTADFAADILKGMGQEILPLLKKGFDPKGRNETQRRLNIIEKIGKGSENVFYLEQLENSEKETRRLLIYSLRFDESNIERLIELAETEKGKIKDAAFYALGSMENEKCRVYFEEYGEKDPAYILKLMRHIKTSWSGGVAARLISVITKKGSITFSEIGKAKLKSIVDALWGKCGADIEKIYRNFQSDDIKMMLIHLTLGNSIVVTRDESLRKLAIELNSAPKTKGLYLYAEIIARLMGNEDCSEWLEKQLKASCNGKNSAYINNTLFTVLDYISFKDGSFYFFQNYSDIVNGNIYDVSFEVKQPIKTKFADLLIKYDMVFSGKVLSRWIAPDDREYCQRLGAYFIEKYKETNSITALTSIAQCGLSNIKGLLTNEKLLSKLPQMHIHLAEYNIICLPGDYEYKLSEARELIRTIRENNIKMGKIDIDEFSNWVETEMR